MTIGLGRTGAVSLEPASKEKLSLQSGSFLAICFVLLSKVNLDPSLAHDTDGHMLAVTHFRILEILMGTQSGGYTHESMDKTSCFYGRCRL